MMPLIYLYTGANREWKTTQAIIDGYDSHLPLLVVSRTNDTGQETVKTIVNHISSLEKVPITQLCGMAAVCPRVKESEERFQFENKEEERIPFEISKEYVCKDCKRIKDMKEAKMLEFHDIKGQNIADIDYYKKEYNETYFCPYAIMWGHLEKRTLKENGIIVLTYSMLARFLKKFNNKEFNIIADEARYLADCDFKPLNMSSSKPTKKSHDKILSDFREYIYSNINEEHKLTSEIDKFFKVIDNPDKIPEFDIPSLKTLVEYTLPENDKLSIPVFKILRFCIAFEDENTQLFISKGNDSEGHNYVKAIACPMNENSTEKRITFEFIRDHAKEIYLVDSTPWPSFTTKIMEIHNGSCEHWWLGNNYDIKEVKNFPPSYKFNIVYENVSKNLRQTWQPKIKKKHFIELIDEITKTFLSNHNLKEQIFARNKKEYNIIKKHLPHLNITWARGTETEGVQSKADYTICTGLPYQNMTSDAWRAKAISKSIGLPEDLAMKKYYRIKMLMALIQQSFRTASKEKTSGSIWLNTASIMCGHAKLYFPWLRENINFIDSCCKGLSPSRKTRLIEEAYINEVSADPTLEIKKRIEKDILKLLQKNRALSITKIRNQIIGENKIKSQIIHSLIKREILVPFKVKIGANRPLTMIKIKKNSLVL